MIGSEVSNNIAENQLTCVVLGAGKVLDDEYILEKVKMW